MADFSKVAILLVDGFDKGEIDAPLEYSMDHPIEGRQDYEDAVRQIGYAFSKQFHIGTANKEALMGYLQLFLLSGVDIDFVLDAKNSLYAECIDLYKKAQKYNAAL
jgi:hypothetical protein